MADSFNKKEREKKRRKRKQEKNERKKQKKLDGIKSEEFMYVDENGNLTSTPPDTSVKKKEIKLEDIAISTPKQSDIEEEVIRKGVVKFYNTEKHFGFITETSTGDEYFVHGDNVKGEIRERDKVQYEIGMGNKGPVAVNVELIKG